MSKYPFTQQHEEKDCGAACLSMISEFYGLKLLYARFRDWIKVDEQGANIYGIVTGAEMAGFQADALEGTSEELLEGIETGEIRFPFIARVVEEHLFEHFIVVYAIRKGKVIVGNPAKNKITRITIEEFMEHWLGEIITFIPSEDFTKRNERKGTFKKYFTYILSQKKLLLFVFLVSVIISVVNISGSIVFEYILTESFEEETPNVELEEYGSSRSVVAGEKLSSKDMSGKIIEKVSLIFTNMDMVCVTILLMYLLRCLLEILRGYSLAVMTKKIDIPVTLQYYDHLMDLPMEFHETRKTGELMSRFYDISKIRDAVSSATLTIMLDTIMAIACGALLCYMNVTLFIITVVIMVCYMVIVLLFRNPLRSVNYKLMEEEAQVTSYLKESIDGIGMIKAYQYEKSVKGKLQKLYETLADSSVRGSFIYQIQDSLISLTASAGVVVLLWVGTYLCMADVIRIADLFVFYYLLSYFLSPVSNLINLQPELQTAMVAAERLNDVMNAEKEQKNAGKEEIQSLFRDIQIENVDFRYGNRNPVLQDVNMTFPKGKKIAIVGESGCGKTTLAKLLLGFYDPEQGRILVDGKELHEYSTNSIRKHMAYISQDIFLFSDTIYNNLRVGDEKITDEEIRKMCERLGVNTFIEQLPMGYKTMLEENGNNLSGGQKQRLAIVRALLRKPDVLIMDEATSNLDTVTEDQIKKVLEEYSDDMTWIMIAHRLHTIKSCDIIYVMDRGKVIEQGTHQELLAIDGRYRRLVNSGVE